jgi:hypothetical protein
MAKAMPTTPSSPLLAQLPAPPQVADDFIVPRPDRDLGAAKIGHSIKDHSSRTTL